MRVSSKAADISGKKNSGGLEFPVHLPLQHNVDERIARNVSVCIKTI